MKGLLIDGQLVEAPRTTVSLNPTTGEVIDEAPDATVEQAEAAVKAARRAFDTTDWSTNVEFRIRCMNQLYEALVKHREELRELTIAEVGHPRVMTYGAALDVPIEIVKYYTELAAGYSFTEDLPETESHGMRHRRWVEKEAAGVVSAIIPYNYPTQIALAKVAPALAAGCTVILKGAPDTPLVTLALGEIIANETDIPAGVVNVITSPSVEVAEVLTSHPDVDMITFTGSTPVGRRIMEVASKTVKKVFLELGGKSALIMLDDADAGMVALVATMTICSHAGQGCAVTSRLLVPRERQDEVVEAIKGVLANIKVGNPADEDTYVGPLVSAKQREKVDAMVKRAVEAGATLAIGGEKIDPGFFYTPTILTNVDPDSEIAQDEVFGPVLAVIAYEGDDEAVEIANNSIFGLSGSVIGADDDRAIAVARRIRSGTISVNGGNWFAPDSPFGGYKQSGIGREMGVVGMEEFLERKTLAVLVR
ncbi:aldehyde dehydrogenase family protein [Frankia sp. CNm7]|uniref:Aldehyde dehydrogenase family protein n=1 Tax=Frankia nepalensis TaxID=1836974 RepID=A0A937RRT6_9ACTN|nr:aldehyde dehydrogenase family protein [Frankia nepalensis]MBL7501246.1 aldehyde dehydrogenase family protein [Frankia nepalensis]MBL7509444.1 aldehyde dehydrogenase family protein [Frankia nepalensis]MBL7523344.1 aldehyde dehydrogenase family protein [Frankia nepalensis]MBL7631553.1 aldehyde dehydrogenase family protein [Frankia nepalensis]